MVLDNGTYNRILTSFFLFFFPFSSTIPSIEMFNPIPLWVWIYGEKERSIEELLWDLEDAESGAINSHFSTFRVKLHKMDFVTGATSSDMVNYFKPDLKTKFQIENTFLDPDDPNDDMFPSMLKKKNDPTFDSQKLHQQLRTSFAKYITHSPGGHRAAPGWQFIK